MDAPGAPPVSRRPLWPAVLVGGALIAAGIAVALVHSPPSGQRGGAVDGLDSGGGPAVGRPAPDFSLPLISGGTLSLHSLRGRPVLLNFWASWCVPCREEMPLLVRLHKIYGPRGVEFVGVDTEDLEGDARAFLARYRVDYTLVRGADERLMDAYAIPGLPTTVFVGANGIVQGRVVGGFVGAAGERLLAARLNRLLESARR